MFILGVSALTQMRLLRERENVHVYSIFCTTTPIVFVLSVFFIPEIPLLDLSPGYQ